MNSHSASTAASSPGRRAVATGLAWSVPAVAMVSAAPSFAVSLRKDPGINGWVQVARSGSVGCASDYSIEVTSAPAGGGRTPDGAPWGLYLYDVSPQGVYTNAKLVYWVRGDHVKQNRITWQTATGHSSKWSGPVTGAAQKKADGFVYTPYTWTYTGTINPANVKSDGRLYLETFHVTSSSFSQIEGGRCVPLDYWAYREIVVDPDGSGPQPSTTLHFERRAGMSGAYVSGGQARMAATSATGGTDQL